MGEDETHVHPLITLNGPGPLKWSQTGFSQQQFVNYANNIKEHVYSNGEPWTIKVIDQGACTLAGDKCDWQDDKTKVTNDLCHGGMSEQPAKVECLLVYTNTGLLSVQKAMYSRKPAFSILAPRAWVYVEQADQLHGVVAAERVINTGQNADGTQFHAVEFRGPIETNAECTC